jgi:hypothetical protein
LATFARFACSLSPQPSSQKNATSKPIATQHRIALRLLAQLSEGKKPQKMIKQPTSFGQERDGLKAAICPFQSRFSESLWHFL